LQTIILTEAAFLNGQEPIINERLNITMGVFDGLHCGHQALFKQTVEATANGSKSAIVSFDFSQVDLKKRDNHLLTMQEMETELALYTFDYHIVIAFGSALTELIASEYLRQLTRILQIDTITVGTDFVFGNKGAGDIHLLAEYAPKLGYTLYTVPIVAQDAERVSSRLIEQVLLAGDIATANRLLGYTYTMRGRVIHGEQKGRKLGYPTANMTLPVGKVGLPNGVYITQVAIGATLYDAVTNIGTSPTIKNEDEAIVETHIFDFSADIYDKEIVVYFYDRIRDELKFNTIDALTEQMDADSEMSRAYLASHNRRNK